MAYLRANLPAGYLADYEKGWRSTCDLDRADAHGLTARTGWMDGRSDQAAGRPKWTWAQTRAYNLAAAANLDADAYVELVGR